MSEPDNKVKRGGIKPLDQSPGSQQLTIQQTLDLAVQHHNAADLPKAEGLYQQVLQTDPNQPVALHMLGVIAHQVGKNDIAVDLITKALAVKPDHAGAHNNLGLALRDLGRSDEAVASCHKALAIKPDYAEAHNNLGNVLRDLGKLDEAVTSYHKALAIKPDYAEVHSNLGLALADLGRLDEAVSSYHKALAIKPDYAETHYNLGLVLRDLGKLDEAVTSYHKALAIKPDYAEARNNLGAALKELGRLDEAVSSYHKALAIKPDYAEAHNNLGNLLRNLGKQDEAVTCYHKALALKPDYAEVHSNLGLALSDLGRLDEAAASYRKALQLNPAFAEAHYNLHALLLDPGDMALSIKCMERAVDIDPYRTDYRFILGMLLDYSGNPEEAATHFDMVENGENSDRAKLDAWRYIKSANKKIPPIIGSSIQALKLGIDAAVNDGLVLEFGVRFGTSIRQIAALVEQEVHGFDSFEGLPEAWHHEPKGSYSTKGIIPSVQENVILHNGWFEETLPSFVEKFQAPVRFINIDCDIYSSTKTVLELLAQQITPGTVIVFDEYIGNENWRKDEFKAFHEAVLKYGWKHEYLCFSFITKQVVVRII